MWLHVHFGKLHVHRANAAAVCFPWRWVCAMLLRGLIIRRSCLPGNRTSIYINGGCVRGCCTRISHIKPVENLTGPSASICIAIGAPGPWPSAHTGDAAAEQYYFPLSSDQPEYLFIYSYIGPGPLLLGLRFSPFLFLCVQSLLYMPTGAMIMIISLR